MSSYQHACSDLFSTANYTDVEKMKILLERLEMELFCRRLFDVSL